MNNWNGFDFLIFLIFAANTILGMARGATREIISSICLSVALIFTIKFTVPLAAFFNRSPIIVDVVDSLPIQNFMAAIGAGALTADLLMQVFYALSMLICFVSIFSLCEGSLSMAGVAYMYSFPYATIDRKVGATLGAIRGYIISIMLIAIVTLHIGKSSEFIYSNSFFAHLFQDSAVNLDSIISGQKPEDYQKIFQGKDLYKADDVLQGMQQAVPTQTPPPTQQPAQPPSPTTN